MIKKISIIGSGNGAFTAAADLTLRGFEVTICVEEKYADRIKKIKETGVINLVGAYHTGGVKIHKITTDMANALSDADLIMPIIPATAQEKLAYTLIPYIKEGMIICQVPGSSGGSLILAKIFKEAGVYDKVKLCEMNTLPYASRKINEDTVNILLMVKLMFFAAFPAKYNQELYDLIKPVYPQIKMLTDVLETALNNGNITSHPAAVVLNAGKIEYYGKHSHYKEGITPAVARVNLKVDHERMALCKKFGYKELDVRERLYLTGYAPKSDNLYQAYRGSEGIFLDIKGPNDLSSRYLTEDVPCSLAFCANLAKAVGLETPIMDSITNLASILAEEDYWTTGRTLERVGLAGKNIVEIKDFLQNGY